MFKRPSTPLTKQKNFSRGSSNNQRVLKQIKNVLPVKQSFSRNPTNSKIIFSHQSNTLQVQKVNPESPEIRRKESLKNYIIPEDMRKIIVQWMIQVAHRSNLKRETIFMGIHLFDSVADKLKNVNTQNMQLIATTTLFIAAKYQQIYPQPIQKFLQYTACSYTKQDLLQMEEKILLLLQFKLTFSTRITHFGLIQQSSSMNESRALSQKKYNSYCLFFLTLSLLVRWNDTANPDLAQAASFLAKKVLKYPTGWVNDNILEISYKLMNIWRQNQKSVIAYLFDNQRHCFVGGMKIIY